MDIQRKGVGKKKAIRLAITLVVLAVAGVGITIGLAKLKPAAPSVEMSTLWPDTVRRGPMLREVRGLGTLVPENTMLITARTDGRVERILIRPGTQVRADSVVMILSSPELENILVTAEYALKARGGRLPESQGDAPEAAFRHAGIRRAIRSRLQYRQTAGRSRRRAGQRAASAQSGRRDLQGEGAAVIDRVQIEKKRMATYADQEKAQLDAQNVKVEQLRADYKLKQSQVDQLKVRAGFDGTLQALPPPLAAVEEGQKVSAGAPLGKIAQPSHLKAELKIAETQVKDIAPGSPR